jgi:hypothetical protein
VDRLLAEFYAENTSWRWRFLPFPAILYDSCGGMVLKAA